MPTQTSEASDPLIFKGFPGRFCIKVERVLDPACGTAGFLISAYRHILVQNKDEDGKSTLTADDRKRLAENFAGYDISPDMVRLSRVNMYLHHFTKPKISKTIP